MQEFNGLNLNEINSASTNGRFLVNATRGVFAVFNGSDLATRQKLGNISCLFDEFVTSKYVGLYTHEPLRLHVFNPRCTCAARVTVLGLCVCLSVCVCVCVCLSPLILALQAPNRLKSDTNGSSATSARKIMWRFR